MKKKIALILLLLVSIITLTGCTNNKEDAKKFKEEYESLNGEKRSDGKEFRSIEIDEKNPMIYSSFEEVNKMIDKKESFIVYTGFNACPWCRTVIPYAIKQAKENGIKKIYYINVRENDDKSKDLRGYKKLDDDNKVVVEFESASGYLDFTKHCDSVLDPYVLKDEEGNEYETGEDRLMAPTFFMVINGEVVKATSGISEEQKDGYAEITEKMENDMNSSLNEFFKYFKENK